MDEQLLYSGLHRGFIDSSVSADESLTPQFITNDYDRGEKVITSLKSKMASCDSFMFSVAFVTYGGVNALLNEFKNLMNRGVHGKIIVSQYQNFTQPEALRRLIAFPNIELRIVTEEQSRMHSKCYIFERNGGYDILIGSSNLTNEALCSNCEWNVLLNSNSSGEIAEEMVSEFNRLFESSTPVTTEWIRSYQDIYDELRDYRKSVALETSNASSLAERIVPNRMQSDALANLKRIRDEGGKRALVISATGSGKTYLAAFDAKVFGGRFLYLVHRKNVLFKSVKSFEKVMGGTRSIHVFDVLEGDTGADCMFSTRQTMSNPNVLNLFSRDRFDYILIDEAHGAGSETYQRIISYFNPKFLLGMTATPDRLDGYDIYSLFDHNIAYEIRLKEALEYNLICPFHYFGLSDLTLEGETVDDLSLFKKIDYESRVDHIVSEARFYGHGGKRLKGLIFCQRIDEAKILSTLFNRKGLRTEWVSGNLSPDVVEGFIERLELDEGELCLDYLISVDLFKEGTDIPSINQLIMLRPTESPIVYIQQLGRGLRKNGGKDFLVVLDFVANYEKNYNIPLALSDDRSYNKSEARKFIAAGDSMVYGNSTISFDEITKKRIYDSIDKANFKDSSMLRGAYKDLRNKIGSIPELIDFRKYGSVDALKFIEKWGSYHEFLSKGVEKEYDVTLSKEQADVLKYISKIIAPGKRSLEILALEALNNGCDDFNGLIHSLRPKITDSALKNIIGVFDGTFYNNNISIMEDNHVSDSYLSMLSNEWFKRHIDWLIALGKDNNERLYKNTYRGTDFVLNRMYTYDDVCRFCNRAQNVSAQIIGGYKYNEDSNTFCVFINYKKGEGVVESQRYDDRFENRNVLLAVSKSTEGRNAKNMVRVRDHKANGTTIHLFMRKNKDDKGSKEFYYLGMMDFVEFIGDGKPVEIRYRLYDTVRYDIYEYMIG